MGSYTVTIDVRLDNYPFVPLKELDLEIIINECTPAVIKPPEERLEDIHFVVGS